MAASLSWSEAQDWSGSGPIEEEPAEEEAPTIQVGTALPLPVDQLEVAVLRAQTLFAQGQTRAAVAAFDRALALAPQRAELWAMRGVVRRREADLEGASRDFDAALARDHREPRALVGRGLLHLQQGRTARAVEDLARALELLHPDHPRRADVSTALERARGELRSAGPLA